MNTHLFLDLEDTVIAPVLNGWHNSELLLPEIERIKNAGIHEMASVNIFSFALHDQEQIRLFNKHTRKMLESLLEVEFDLVPCVDKVIKEACCRVLKVSPGTVSFEDMVTFWGKSLSFDLFIQDQFKTGTFILIDDAVRDKATMLNDDGLLIVQRNINSVGK